jgi:hypothetical protein
MHIIKKISIVTAIVLMLSVLFTVNVFAATEYTLDSCSDDPATAINEAEVCQTLVDLYGKQPNTYFALEKTEKCNIEVAVHLNGEEITIWASEILKPKTDSSTTVTTTDDIDTLDEVIDCMIELENEIDVLVFVLIAVVIMAAVAIGWNIFTRYKLNRLKDDFDAYVASKNKKKNNKK